MIIFIWGRIWVRQLSKSILSLWLARVRTPSPLLLIHLATLGTESAFQSQYSKTLTYKRPHWTRPHLLIGRGMSPNIYVLLVDCSAFFLALGQVCQKLCILWNRELLVVCLRILEYRTSFPTFILWFFKPLKVSLWHYFEISWVCLDRSFTVPPFPQDTKPGFQCHSPGLLSLLAGKNFNPILCLGKSILRLQSLLD